MNFRPRISEPIDALQYREKRNSWINDKNTSVFTILSSHIIRNDIRCLLKLVLSTALDKSGGNIMIRKCRYFGK